MKRYKDCVRTDGMCGMCSLVNYGRDCYNQKINGLLYQRTSLPMTQKELSDKSGVNIRQIQKYESGEYNCENMTLKNALALADVLNCEVKSFV